MEELLYNLYKYIIYYHPCMILARKAEEYEPITNIGAGVWIPIAIFGTVAWFGLARFLAETPGRKHGSMWVWWIVVLVLHIWALPVYFIYDFIVSFARSRWQDSKEAKYTDRSKEEIYASARKVQIVKKKIQAQKKIIPFKSN